MHTIRILAPLAALGLLAAGCRPAPSSTSTPKPVSAADKEAGQLSAEVAAVFSAKPTLANPTPIPEARTKVKPGDTVLLEGKIMGVKTPFVEGRSVFVLGDTGTLTPCGCSCKTPWDLCCAPHEARLAGTATIQITDASGVVLRSGLRGVRGLRELSQVRVEGVVAEGSTADTLIVNARGIEVQ